MHRGHYSFSMPKPYTSLNLPQKFPEDIECIIKGKSSTQGSLYISNIQAAENLNTLKKFQIGAVLTCAKGYELHHPTRQVPLYKYIATIDHESCDISLYFDQAADFIKDALAQTNILVHCIAGVSRSVSMTIAYLIRQQGMTYDQAYKFVKSRRRIIHPNDGFITLLKKYQQKVKGQAQKRKADLSPQFESKYKSGAVTPTKLTSNHYERLSQYTSTQLTPQPRAKYEDKHIDRYQSTQLTPNKNSATQYLYTPQTKKFKYDMYLNSNYDTAGRQNDNHKKYLPKAYQTLVKTPTHTRGRGDRHKAVSQTIIQIDPPKQESLTPKNIEYITKKSEEVATKSIEDGKNKQGYFDVMNKELSQKIDEIRKKYDNQRQKLYQKYQSGDKKPITPLVKDDDYMARSPLLRHNYATVQNRNKSVNDLTSKKESYLDTYETFRKSSAFERTKYQGYSDVSDRLNPKDYGQTYTSSSKDYFSRNRQSHVDRSNDVYIRKFNFNDNQEQNNGDISNRYDQLRRKIDARLKNYGKYQRIDPYGEKSYNDYLSRYPSHYGYRQY